MLCSLQLAAAFLHVERNCFFALACLVNSLWALHWWFLFLLFFISDVLPASFDLSGTDSALYPYDPEQGSFRDLLFPPATNMYPYFLFPPNTLHPRLTHSLPYHPTTHTDTQMSVEEVPLDYDEPDDKLTSSYSGSISVKVMSSDNSTPIEGIESQLENPLVGIRGTAQKDKGALRQELQGIPSNGNSSLFDEDGESRGPSITPENPKVHSSMYPIA